VNQLVILKLIQVKFICQRPGVNKNIIKLARRTSAKKVSPQYKNMFEPKDPIWFRLEISEKQNLE
jgi:hypothetical protein